MFQDGRRTRLARVGVAGAAALLAVGIAACTSSSGSSSPSSSSTASAGAGVAMTGQVGAVPDMATGAEKTGTVTVAAPPNSAPTWILPLVTGAADSVFDVDEFDYQMYRPLYWLVNGVEPTETPTMSLANDPTWSNGDKAVTFTLKSNYKWSNGDPITSADVLFWFYETKAALKESPANWAAYTPGLGVPDEVASISAPNATTVTMKLTKAVNPTWFMEDEIGDIQPWPSQAWNLDATGGKHITDWATNPADAKKIYDYLTVQSKSLSTYASNPLWQVVDGPYKLSAFTASTGAFTLVPNTTYGGPHATTESDVQFVPFTSDTAEYNALVDGSVDVGYVPLTNVPKLSTLTSKYNDFGYTDFGWNYVSYNFGDTTADFNNIIDKLYIRQALAHLEDEPGYIHAFFNGAGGQAFGPVPVLPKSPVHAVHRVDQPVPVQPVRCLGPAEGERLDGGAQRHGHVLQAGHRHWRVRRGHPGRHQARLERRLRHRPGRHRRAGAGLGVAGEDGRHHDEPVLDQLRLRDRQLQRPVVAEDRQQVGDGRLRRVHRLHLPDHLRGVQRARLGEPRRLQRPDGELAHHELDLEPEPVGGDQ